MMSLAFRFFSWLCAAVALLNFLLILLDGCRADSTFGTRAITFVVASFFAWIGLAVLGVEWNVRKLRPFLPAGTEGRSGWGRNWLWLHLFLTGAVLFALMVMVVGFTGIVARAHEGRPLFG